MSHSYIAYIDESGDEGFKKFRDRGIEGSTRWLVISSVVVRASQDLETVSYRDEISSGIPYRKKRDIHFRNLNHEQRLHACNVLSQKKLQFISVMSNKTTIPNYQGWDPTLFSKRNTLYWYVCRYLVERLSWLARDFRRHVPEGNGQVKIIFSTRGGLNYRDFQSYLRGLKANHLAGLRPTSIHWPVIDIEAVSNQDHSTSAGVQLADCIATAFAHAVDPNYYGLCEPRYAKILKPNVYNRSGRYQGYGVKPIPSFERMDMTPEQQEFFDLYP